MKTVIALLIVFASSFATISASASASTPETKSEAMRVANVMLDNPSATAQLNQEGVNIIDYSIVEDGKGVNTFTFKLGRTCFCIPKSGTLTIVQDLRPSFADGPIKYTSELIWN